MDKSMDKSMDNPTTSVVNIPLKSGIDKPFKTWMNT